ncbi:hypothetical protein DER45DRAFT_354182 [Fusarium avenaceum]|nr:hypothetical protein DER45DRAFT_354182 [Fusarium avenaceum]
MAFGRFYHSFRRWLFPSPDPRGDLTVLPLDIILEIAQHLPDAGLLCLSLTCRPYHSLLSSAARNARLEGADLEDFLLLLEKDSTTLYFCYSCVRLHRWSPRWTNKSLSRRLLYRSSCVRDFMFYSAWQPGLTVYHPHVKLVMNRHFYGASHGLSLSTLKYHGHDRLYKQGGSNHWAMDARIINDELFLRRSFKSRFRNDFEQRRYLLQVDFVLCSHIVGGDFKYIQKYCIPELVDSSELKQCANSLGSCPVCLTDYSISIYRQGNGKSWDIEVTGYQQLGACRSPFDWKWRTLAERTPWNEPRCLAQEPGLVRQRWMVSQGLDCPPAGKYIGKVCPEPGILFGSRRCPWHGNCRECEHYRAEMSTTPYRLRHRIWYPLEE